ncbi:MAG: sugar ABC transporter ATP-binding protein [Sarcina sp.]
MDDKKQNSNILIELKNIYKSFSNNTVLKGVNLELMKGEVVSIIGGNGAGKSTLMKIIMGIYKADSGEIFLDGEKTHITNPTESISRGIYLVPQEPLLFPNMTVEENILMGFKENKLTLKRKLGNLLADLSWDLGLDRSVNTLSIADHQLIEILRGLLRESKILILDEPTSTLTFKEIKTLFKIIRDLKDKGIGIFYITHRLNEVFEISSRVVILRDGKITLSNGVENVSKEMLIDGLLPEGKAIKQVINKDEENFDYSNKKNILVLKNYNGYGFKDINFELYEGEVLGIAGVVGAGRTELAESIFGLSQTISGNVFLDDYDITGKNTREIIKKGINYIPEDRRLNGIFGIGSVTKNITSGILPSINKFFINKKKEKEIAKKHIEDLRIKVTSDEQSAISLSGGNQQKVVIGKILSSEPKVIILDEPTRGIDAGARCDVYKIIRNLKQEKKAILLISSDLEEIMELSDRILVMYAGRIEQSFRKNDISIDTLMAAAYGIKQEVNNSER